LLAQLSKQVKDSLTINTDREIYWSDPTITLAWIAGSPNRWKQFVSNRVAENNTFDKLNHIFFSRFFPIVLLSTFFTHSNVEKKALQE
jgi:hypothetical protein